MRWIILALLVVVLVAGCGYRGEIATRGAEVSDAALGDAEWYICNAAPVGSVKRRYGDTPERVEAYRELCTSASEPVIE